MNSLTDGRTGTARGRWGLCAATALAVASLGGCASHAGHGAGLGAGLGAIGGAIIGHQSGHGGEGAAIGAGIGAVTGYVIGNERDKYESGYRARSHHRSYNPDCDY